MDSSNNSISYRAAAVEQHLRSLQDAHRLAIHVWEYYEPYRISNELWQPLSSAPLEVNLGHQHRPKNAPYKPKSPQFSMSLLPSTHSAFSMKPFGITEEFSPEPAYLFDLRQTRQNPAKVFIANLNNIVSGDNVYRKDSRFDTAQGGTADLKHCYSAYGSELALQKAVLTDPQVTETQLDILANQYEKSPPPKELIFDKKNPSVVSFNEILVAAHTSHIAAICMPSFHSFTAYQQSEPWAVVSAASRRYPSVSMEERRAYLEMVGCLQGLEHLEKGLDVPVVFYHVNGPDKGKITYIAQGRTELIEKALAAIALLQEHQSFDKFKYDDADFPHLIHSVSKQLHVDLEKPLSAQAIASPRNHLTLKPDYKGTLRHTGPGMETGYLL